MDRLETSAIHFDFACAALPSPVLAPVEGALILESAGKGENPRFQAKVLDQRKGGGEKEKKDLSRPPSEGSELDCQRATLAFGMKIPECSNEESHDMGQAVRFYGLFHKKLRNILVTYCQESFLEWHFDCGTGSNGPADLLPVLERAIK